jgi:hypothetical protein
VNEETPVPFLHYLAPILERQRSAKMRRRMQDKRNKSTSSSNIKAYKKHDEE